MRYLTIVSIAVVAVAVALVATGERVDASPSNAAASCTRADGVGADYRFFAVRAREDNNTEGSGCTSPAIFSVPAGSPFYVVCTQGPIGAGAPGIANTVAIKLVSDNVGYGSAAPSAIRTITYVNNGLFGACDTSDNIHTVACTSDGTTTGAPYYGVIRLHIRAIRTDTGTYDVHSEDETAGSDHGIMKCTPGLTKLTESHPQAPYVAGDTIGATYAVNATPYDTTNSGKASLVCGGGLNDLAADHVLTTDRTKTATIKGTVASWPDDCALSVNWTWTRFSSVNGYSNTLWANFSGTPPSGVVFSVNGRYANNTTTKIVDRTLTHSTTCEYHLNASGAVSTVFNRVEGVTSHCHGAWRDARNTDVGTGVFARGYLASPASASTAAYPSQDLTTTGTGASAFTSSSVSDAATGSYGTWIETYVSSGRPASDLLGFGTSAAAFTLSKDWAFDNIFNAKSDGGQNESVFVLPGDVQWVSARGLRNARGEAVSGLPVTCQRVDPRPVAEPAEAMGATDVGGNTAYKLFFTTPPTGEWTTTCTSSGAGNNATYVVKFMIVASVPANTTLSLSYWIGERGTCLSRLNVSAHVERISQDGSHAVMAPDAGEVVWTSVEQLDPGGSSALLNVVPKTAMVKAGSVWYHEACLTDIASYSKDHSNDHVTLHVWTNVTHQVLLRTVPVPTRNTTVDTVSLLHQSTAQLALPYVLMLLASASLLVLGTRYGPGWYVLGAAVGGVGVFASLATDTTAPLPAGVASMLRIMLGLMSLIAVGMTVSARRQY